MSETQYVIVDWRPYDLPTVIGPFASENDAERYYLWLHDMEDEYDNLDDLDGIDIRILEKRIDNA